jgi:lysophospholipase L1-like esterase
MKTILFMGDSITDAGRATAGDYPMGYGYATMVAGELGFENPGKYVFKNRGISGHRLIDLLARIDRDMINIAPDYMSILVGVNDALQYIGGDPNGFGERNFEIYYDLMLSQLKEALPNVKIMIFEPFLLRVPAIEEKWDGLKREVDKRRIIIRKLAEKYDLPFIPLMSKFEAAAAASTNECWSRDGVHPSVAGHELIKRAWIEAFYKYIEKP